MAGDESDKLQYENQRARCRFGKRESIDHFSWAQPLKLRNDLLCYVREYRIGAAERDQRGLAKEYALAP